MYDKLTFFLIISVKNLNLNMKLYDIGILKDKTMNDKLICIHNSVEYNY